MRESLSDKRATRFSRCRPHACPRLVLTCTRTNACTTYVVRKKFVPDAVGTRTVQYKLLALILAPPTHTRSAASDWLVPAVRGSYVLLLGTYYVNGTYVARS